MLKKKRKISCSVCAEPCTNGTFYCLDCCFSDKGYDFEAALKRIEEKLILSDAEGWEAAKQEKNMLETYGIKPPYRQNCVLREQKRKDHVSYDLLKKLQPGVLKEYLPVQVVGDGNCMYRALSLSLFGSQKIHKYLRLLTVIELMENQPKYDSSSISFVDYINDEDVISNGGFSEIVLEAVRLYTYSRFIHLYAASAALQLPIQSFMASSGLLDKRASTYTRKVVGRGVRRTKSPACVIMWTITNIPPQGFAQYKPNHFVQLVKNTMKNQLIQIDICETEIKQKTGVCKKEKNPPHDGVARDTQKMVTNGGFKNNAIHIDVKETDVEDTCSEEVEKSSGKNAVNYHRENTGKNEDIRTHGNTIETEQKSIFPTKKISYLKNEAVQLHEDKIEVELESDSDFETKNGSNLIGIKLDDDKEEFVVTNSLEDYQETTLEETEASNSKEYSNNIYNKSPERISKALIPNAFMPIKKVLQKLLDEQKTVLTEIPKGKKEDVYFIAKNSYNEQRENEGFKRSYFDDCGAWVRTSARSSFFYVEKSNLFEIHKCDGLYCRRVNRMSYEPIEPQPNLENILAVKQQHSQLQRQRTYKRRITWIRNSNDKEPSALYEYAGIFPAIHDPHGNSKSGQTYVRTNPKVLDKIKERSTIQKGKNLYDDLILNGNDFQRPRAPRQIYDHKYLQKKRN